MSLKEKSVENPGPFRTETHKTERAAVAVMMHWMREIIDRKNLDLGMPDVETSADDRKMPDAVIYESRRSQKVLCVIEAKLPQYDVFDEKELKEPARMKATTRQAKYFALTNFKELVWFNTEKANTLKPEEEQILHKYSLSGLENINDIEQVRHSNSIKKGLEDFLVSLYSVYSGKEPEPKLPLDELLVFRLHEKVRVLSTYYKRIIEESQHRDIIFTRNLKKWFANQGWTFTGQSEDFDKAARQTAYLLVNKILFYDALQSKRRQELDPLEIAESLTKSDMLRTTLEEYFKQVLKIDYETIYTTDFIDRMAFPDAAEVVKEVKELVKVLKRYDFSTLGYDIIGRICERLIPQQERHNLGQYFTRSDVVDLILRFCMHHEDDKVLDPACGAGTFLVRAYQHKKMMNQRKSHEEILETLWGDDIAKFPAHLATINLAINDLSVEKNYPNIIQEDFFALKSDGGFELTEKCRKVRAKTFSRAGRQVTLPKHFDAIVGNPPYTRQEEIPGIGVDKRRLIESALRDSSGKMMAQIGKRAGIHAYFFVHGTKFLRDNGHFGFIVSNSWLDVDYGKGLQEFFLNNYKIIAIIESKIERWFEEADINTCIVILQKCKDKKERDENLVRFVYLKKPLRHFIPPAQDIWEKQVERVTDIDKLKKTILAHDDFYENEELRIFPKSQNDLWEEGFDSEAQKYVGAKWGKYLRAPEIFFKILEKGKGKLVPLKAVAKVRRGFTTGANDFFYLTEEQIKRRGIEKQFWMHKDNKGNWVPNYVLRSFKETPSLVVHRDNLRWRILLIGKDRKFLAGKKVLRYIRQGERRQFKGKIPAETVTCKSRGRQWYNLGRNLPASIFYPRRIGDRFLVPYVPEPIYSSDNLFPVVVASARLVEPTAAFLNSAVTALFNELSGRRLTGAINVVDMDVWMACKLPVINFKGVSDRTINSLKQSFAKLGKRLIEHSLKEFGGHSAEEVSLDRVKPDRRELDRIIMGEILGLTDEEQLEVYKAVVDLVKSRIEKAKSVGKNKKAREGIDLENLEKAVVEQVKRE